MFGFVWQKLWKKCMQFLPTVTIAGAVTLDVYVEDFAGYTF